MKHFFSTNSSTENQYSPNRTPAFSSDNPKNQSCHNYIIINNHLATNMNDSKQKPAGEFLFIPSFIHFICSIHSPNIINDVTFSRLRFYGSTFLLYLELLNTEICV